MPISDSVVLLGVAVGTPVFALLLRRRGVRGRRWFVTTWLAFFGIALLLMMSTHSVEVVYNTIRGGRALDGSAWAYNFRTYSLILLAAVLFVQGAQCLRAAPKLAVGDAGAQKDAVRAALIVLAVTAPLIPIHTFFGIVLTALSVLTLVILMLISPGRTAHL